MDIAYILPPLLITISVIGLWFARQMPNEPSTVIDKMVVTVAKNLTKGPIKQKSIIMPLTSMIPVLIPEGEITDVEVKIENMLLCEELPMVPIVIKDFWIAPGTRLSIAVHKTLDGEIVRIERI